MNTSQPYNDSSNADSIIDSWREAYKKADLNPPDPYSDTTPVKFRKVKPWTKKKAKEPAKEEMTPIPLPEGAPALPPIPAGYDYWEYVPEGLTGPQHDPWDRCFKKSNPPYFTGNTRPTPQGEASVKDRENYWDIRAVKRTTPKAPIPRSDTIVIDLPASAIVFTEDDGTPIGRACPPAKLSNIKHIGWDFNFNDFNMDECFHIHKLPILNYGMELIPTNTLDATSKSMLPRQKTESGKQYYCVMIYGKMGSLAEPLKTFQEFICHAAHNEIGITEAKKRISRGNNEAIYEGSGIINKALGHRYAIHQSNDTMETRYMFQLIMDPSSLTML